MATFDSSLIFSQDTHTAVYDNAEGFQTRFYDLVRKKYEMSGFPNLVVTEEEFSSGGFFHKESTKMIKVRVTKSQFAQYEIFFRAQTFGNVVVFTVIKYMEKALWGGGKNPDEIYHAIREKCKNWAQYEEFTALDSLADTVFINTLVDIDPNFKENRELTQLVKAKNK